MQTQIKTVSENKSEQFLLAILMAIQEGNKEAVMGGLLFLFDHLKAGGEMPQTCVNNLLELAEE